MLPMKYAESLPGIKRNRSTLLLEKLIDEPAESILTCPEESRPNFDPTILVVVCEFNWRSLAINLPLALILPEAVTWPCIIKLLEAIEAVSAYDDDTSFVISINAVSAYDAVTAYDADTGKNKEPVPSRILPVASVCSTRW